MPNYDFRCEDHGEFQVYLTQAEKKALGTEVPCWSVVERGGEFEDCMKPSKQVFCSGPVLYNAPGFYGCGGTALGHITHGQ